MKMSEGEMSLDNTYLPYKDMINEIPEIASYLSVNYDVRGRTWRGP